MITDTSKNPRPEWNFGMNPGAIEAQEAAGQSELCRSSQLPKQTSSGDAKELYDSMGITVTGGSKGDDLFYDVVLPAGWKLVATDHSMWSDLVDNKGKKRAEIFYKAANYDRRSFIMIAE